MNMTRQKREISYSDRPSLTRRGGSWRGIGLLGLALATAIVSPAQDEQALTSSMKFARLVSFNGSDGGYPTASPVQATDGNLYGTTLSSGQNGGGTVFSITPTGTVTTLYSFCSQTGCTDGANPAAGLIQGTDGNLYGTTESGGSYGYGTVFKITLSGTLTTLYSFCSQSNCTDGYSPVTGLVQATDGNFYGTTQYGPSGYIFGTVFKITPSGVLTTLHSFTGGTDGGGTVAGLIQASDGNLYGTAWFSNTIFQVTLSGTLTTIYKFCSQSGCPDGSSPQSGLIQATDGNLYGTTRFGGANGKGTVFKISLGGTLATLYSFCSQTACADGENPAAGLIQATDGNFYGVTLSGGATSTCEPFGQCGTAFQITPSGTLTTIHSFCPQGSCLDGEYPFGGLVQDTNGAIYGTAQFGGTSLSCAYSCGTVFALLTGLGPFVETQPGFGAVGAQVNILGNRLSDTTSVSFNGTAAFFKIISSSEIQAIVPTGATTGLVTVTARNRTLKSNVNFQVLP
jgi:uncharacterized repeat protein (TIGR03803 family)